MTRGERIVQLIFIGVPWGLMLSLLWRWDPISAVLVLLMFLIQEGIDRREMEKEVTALRLRVADLDRDVTALEASTYGDGK